MTALTCNAEAVTLAPIVTPSTHAVIMAIVARQETTRIEGDFLTVR